MFFYDLKVFTYLFLLKYSWFDAFELWCWRRLLRAPWTAKRFNQSILKEISPECSLERLMLKLQYFGHLMQRTDSLEKTLMLRKIEGRRRRGRQDEMVGWHHWLHEYEFEQALVVGDGQGILACCSPWDHKESNTTEWLNWELIIWFSTGSVWWCRYQTVCKFFFNKSKIIEPISIHTQTK